VLERNLIAAEGERPLEEVGGIYALIGATGVGKTTSTAKIAAAFATRHGSGNLGLITLDAYRVGAQEAAAHLRPHPRRAGAHRARPCLARRHCSTCCRARAWS
jgi:signal recognition particle GTPase